MVSSVFLISAAVFVEICEVAFLMIDYKGGLEACGFFRERI